MMYEDLKTRLECPVCSKICLPPVMQCRNGHSTCNACRAKIRSCPTCREIDIDVRNLFAEQAVVFMSMACEYAMFGCTVEMTFRDKDTVRHTISLKQPLTLSYLVDEPQLC